MAAEVKSVISLERVECVLGRVASIPGVGVAWSRLFSQKELESDSGFGSMM